MDAILRNLAGYRPPPPGPQLFGPPPKARAKPTSADDAARARRGPAAVDPRAARAARGRPPDECEAPPTAEETLAALGAPATPGGGAAAPRAPPTAEEAMEALGVPRYVRDALRAPPTAEEATEDVRDARPGAAAARAEEAAAERLRQHPEVPREALRAGLAPRGRRYLGRRPPRRPRPGAALRRAHAAVLHGQDRDGDLPVLRAPAQLLRVCKGEDGRGPRLRAPGRGEGGGPRDAGPQGRAGAEEAQGGGGRRGRVLWRSTAASSRSAIC